MARSVGIPTPPASRHSGQAQRRPGLRAQNDFLFLGCRFTPGGGLGGLALGKLLAAPPGLRAGEPTGYTGRVGRVLFCFKGASY